MSYQVLARKYRPQTFDDVIGQETVTRTLQNSVTGERTADAYIFCGPRGVGKTSVARLLSKALNCEKPLKDAPCNNCISCREITQGNDMDVLEIDGASNNSVDEVRTLRENVKFSPSRGKFKIYIIDEVHMLSQGAFNALLKTLEEPPDHVKFIFATTESQKVPATIMSRCQRFDFRQIPPGMILERLNIIAKKEKVSIEEKAALLIARSAEGSLRDALVVLDQMISFSGDKISAEGVVELLGMVSKDRVYELSEAVIGCDSVRIISIIEEMINSGRDPVFIANSLIAHYRDLMILKTTASPTSDMAFAEDELDLLKGQLEKLTLKEILYILQNLLHCLTLMKNAMFARAPFEVTLIRLTERGSMLPLGEVLKKLDTMDLDSYAGTGSDRMGGISDKSTVSPIPNHGSSQKNSNVMPDQKVADPSTHDPDQEYEENTAEESFKTPQAGWRLLLNYIRKTKMSVYTFLNVAKPLEFNKEKVVIGFGREHAFNMEALETENNKSVVKEAADKVTGSSPRIEFVFLEFSEETEKKEDEIVRKKAKAKEEMKPVIEKAMDVFGGHVVRDVMEEGE